MPVTSAKHSIATPVTLSQRVVIAVGASLIAAFVVLCMAFSLLGAYGTPLYIGYGVMMSLVTGGCLVFGPRDRAGLMIAGGLGVPVLQYLAGAGIGRLVVIDGDRLEASNLHRQTWFALADCGQPKAQLAAERIRALNPEVRVEAHALRLDKVPVTRVENYCATGSEALRQASACNVPPLRMA